MEKTYFTTFHRHCKFCRTECNTNSMFVSGTNPKGSRQNIREMHLPLYRSNFYGENSLPSENTSRHVDQLYTNSKSTTLSNTQGEKTSPKVLDDVKSAAIALTSLSLSPGQGKCTSADDGKAKKDWSPINYFIFPPTNTPTEENTSKYFYTPKLPSCISNTEKLTYATNIINNSRKQYKKNHEASDNEESHVHQEALYNTDTTNDVKPRSFSYRDCKTERTNPVPIHCKPRSYSFDAVGRASKYISAPDSTYYDQQIGHHSAPLSRSPMIQGKLGSSSGDDGFCSSSGSADSLEHAPTKRKHKARTIFRCMWRGCDKELTSLPGIILHVRHAHIGPSNAGEEEFYFNDVNVDSSTTSGISSSEESLHEHCSKSKYRKSITDETLLNCDDGLLQTVKIKMEDQHCVKYERYVDTVASSEEIKKPLPKKIADQPVICNNKLKIQHGGEPYKTTTQHSIENLLRHNPHQESTAQHINSPSFNMNFSSGPFQAANTCRIFLQTEMTPQRRGKGRKKCRKVYGMSNKDLWCTQCKWKKACTRFT